MIKKLYLHQLSKHLEFKVGKDWLRRKMILFGASNRGVDFLNLYPDINVSYFVDNDPKKQGCSLNGIPVCSPTRLFSEKKENVLVFITSSFKSEISNALNSNGLKEGIHYFYGTQFASTVNSFKFYLQSNTDLSSFLINLKQMQIEYVVLRFFESLPKTPDGDIDLLINSKSFLKFTEVPGISVFPPGYKVDIYLDKNVDDLDFSPYYPYALSRSILSDKVLAKDLFYHPNKRNYFFSLLYHIAYHKAEASGWPSFIQQKSNEKEAVKNKYTKTIEALARQLGMNAPTTLEQVHNLLTKNGWAAPIDTIRRYAIVRESTFLNYLAKPVYPDNEKGEVLVFVLRQWLIDLNLHKKTTEWFEEQGLKLIDLVMMNTKEQERARYGVRGGNWFNNKSGKAGGYPAALLVLYDPCPIKPDIKDQQQRPFCSNIKYALKDRIRDEFNQRYGSGTNSNFIHSADDAKESYEYIAILDNAKQDRLKKKINTFLS